MPRVKLPSVGKSYNFNVGPVTFNGDISIVQKAQGNSCTLRVEKSNYTLQEGRFVLGSAADREADTFVGYFSVTQETPACRSDSINGGEGIALASNFPLATLSSTFKEIRLVVSSDAPHWRQDQGAVTTKPEVLRGQLAQLCKGHSTANPESKRAKIVETNIKALRPESSTQEDQLGTVSCQSVTHAGKGEDKGKGKEVELRMAPEPVIVSASEKLKAFTRGANEKRKAAKAAKEVDLAEARSKHAAEMAALEQMWAERLRLVEEDIASDEAELHSLLENYLPVVSNRTLNQ